MTSVMKNNSHCRCYTSTRKKWKTNASFTSAHGSAVRSFVLFATILAVFTDTIFSTSSDEAHKFFVAHAAFVANAGSGPYRNHYQQQPHNTRGKRLNLSTINSLDTPSKSVSHFTTVLSSSNCCSTTSRRSSTATNINMINNKNGYHVTATTNKEQQQSSTSNDPSATTGTMLSGCEYYEDEYCYDPELVKNHAYINSLEKNLRTLLDKWIMTGRPDLQQQAQGILTQVRRNALEDEQISRIERLMSRAGMVYGPRSIQVEERLMKQQQQAAAKQSSLTSNTNKDGSSTPSADTTMKRNGRDGSSTTFPRVPVETGHDVNENRKSFAKARQEWESNFQQNATFEKKNKKEDVTSTTGSMASNVVDNMTTARSALSSRSSSSASEKATNFVDSIKNIDDTANFIRQNTYQEQQNNKDEEKKQHRNNIETNQYGPQTDDQWNRMYAMLQKYYRDHGHTNVPLKYVPYPKLGIWVELQREQYHYNKNHGELTKRQIDLLNNIQFDWQIDDNDNENTVEDNNTPQHLAEQLTSDLVAKAGSGNAFEGQQLGIGGLEDVLKEIKRRIWVPLAAPPSLLSELGISPVRGLLLYGQPGCGKTLLARTLGGILSPARPITVVSGPELMEKFVGQSEANLRAVFDNPPNVYEELKTTDDEQYYDALNKAALHVIVLDEFDAMARTRGGKGGTGDNQGDAGVARDSVVNQLLAKMDGVDNLIVPTLVIGMTNKRTLIEPALLRPGRFEVQIEVPPPRTIEQRISILRVHTQKMYDAGRLFVKDAPITKIEEEEEQVFKDSSTSTAASSTTTAASRRLNTMMEGNEDSNELVTYEQLLQHLAEQTSEFSGAMLAGVARAAASHALERAVCEFAGTTLDDENNTKVDESTTTEEHQHHASYGRTIADCLVTKQDLDLAIQDVRDGNPTTTTEFKQEQQQQNDDKKDNTWDKSQDQSDDGPGTTV